MAKNKNSTRSVNYTSDYAQQQENIRKARGNPNKNVHRKKNGSNYGGADYVAQRQARKQEEQTRSRRTGLFDLTPAGRIVFTVLLVATIVMMILGNSSLKDTLAGRYVPSLLVGLTCCFLAYNGFLNRNNVEKTTRQKVLQWVLTGFGILYTFLGLSGLLGIISR